MELATLIISSASFMTGSARGLYGSGSGNSSAVLGKLLVRRQKINADSAEVKGEEAPKGGLYKIVFYCRDVYVSSE